MAPPEEDDRPLSDPRHGDVTRLLGAVGDGSEDAAGELLGLVYDELRAVARGRLSGRGGQTLQPTALVHEAYLRLMGREQPRWESRRHFFAAAARAMRDIIVERARAATAGKRGGGHRRVDLESDLLESGDDRAADVLSLDESLARLEQAAPDAAQVVMLRFFAGLTVTEVAAALETSPSSVDRHWAYAKAWLHRDMAQGEG